ncbi:methylenetetrahydrofolate reductase [Cohnella nanjingensis]|uniref:Methylenetetrahydrofolate reductase n=1 Tax=Cohnella nanjingensis TaxID=1387779 RepID=A0A7X0VID8_9BACL|nr:methylenetetrahydrofolate reductase [Cohnella nanjingensis]MBB6674438.1 methylenetetrahydrofolate reductase [Cohnella nanjingensis]
MLRQKIARREPGILTYGITPPKATHTEDKIAEIAQKQVDRLRNCAIDGLILYDVQDEADRIDEDRPFPYLATVDPTRYSKDYLQALDAAKIIYKVVGKQSKEELADWIRADEGKDRFSVFVGASSSRQAVTMRLPEAYRLGAELNGRLQVGGVVIPERHESKGDEHLRAASKQESGCAFFISQAAYDVEASKNFLSDYYYHCREHGIPMVPILFNLAPCGSQKTLAFMKWLGISIPRWLENELTYCNDILDRSVRLSRKIFEELFEFGLEKGIPIGCSVESVSTRKVEIDASVDLLREMKLLMENRLQTEVAKV